MKDDFFTNTYNYMVKYFREFGCRGGRVICEQKVNALLMPLCKLVGEKYGCQY